MSASGGKRRPKTADEHLDELLEEKRQAMEDVEEERRSERTSYSNTGVWQGMKWTFVFTILLWWFPVYGQMIAGYIGGRKAGSASKALIASSVPAAMILGLAYAIDYGYLPIPKEWLVEGPKYVSERISEQLPVGIPYIDVLVTSFSSVLTAQMSYFAVVILFALIGGVLADEGTKTTLVKGYKVTGQYSLFDDAPHRVDSALDSIVDKVSSSLGIHHDERPNAREGKGEDKWAPRRAAKSWEPPMKGGNNGWESAHLVEQEVKEEPQKVKAKSDECAVALGEKWERPTERTHAPKPEKRVPPILARPRKSALEKMGVQNDAPEPPVYEKKRKLVEDQVWKPPRPSRQIEDSWNKREKAWSPKDDKIKNKIWPKLKRKRASEHLPSGPVELERVDVKATQEPNAKNENNELDELMIAGKPVKDVPHAEPKKLPKYIRVEEEEHLWDADLKIVESEHERAREEPRRQVEEREKPKPEAIEELINIDQPSEEEAAEEKPKDKSKHEDHTSNLRFDDDEPEPSDWDRL